MATAKPTVKCREESRSRRREELGPDGRQGRDAADRKVSTSNGGNAAGVFPVQLVDHLARHRRPLRHQDDRRGRPPIVFEFESSAQPARLLTPPADHAPPRPSRRRNRARLLCERANLLRHPATRPLWMAHPAPWPACPRGLASAILFAMTRSKTFLPHHPHRPLLGIAASARASSSPGPA